MNNKGALNLGISTVVVLVIAMVVIGAGVSFITNFFNLGEESLSGAFNVQDFGLQPTRGTPIVTDRAEISIKSGDDIRLRVGVYNSYTGGVVNLNLSNCINAQSQDTIIGFTAAPQTIDAGRTAGYETYVIAKQGTAPNATSLANGRYICSLVAHRGGTEIASQQVTINVYT